MSAETRKLEFKMDFWRRMEQLPPHKNRKAKAIIQRYWEAAMDVTRQAILDDLRDVVIPEWRI